MHLEIQRSRSTGSATLYEGDGEAARAGIRKFIAAVPRDAKVYGLALDGNRQLVESSLAERISDLALVEIELDRGKPPGS